MSASKRKKERKELYPNGNLAKQEQALAAEKEHKKYTKLAIVTVAILVVVGLVAGFFTSSIPLNMFTAVTVGDHELSAAQFTYYYKDAYFNYYNTYGEYMSYMMDTTASLDSQVYDEATGETWADFFIGEAMTTAASTYELYDVAVASGFTLSDEEVAYIDSNLESLDYIASMYGYSSADAYLTQSYGRGATTEGYRDYMTISSTAVAYSTQQQESYTYDQATMDATYAASPEYYDEVDYKIYYVCVPTGETNEDGSIIADMDAGLALAEEMAEASYQNIDEFDRYAVELADESKVSMYSDPDYTLRSNTTLANASSPLIEWLSDESRVEGDTTVVQADSIAYYVAYFIDRPDMSQSLPNFRDIYVAATADAESTTDPTGMIAAKAIADEVITSYEGGETFETLVSNYSQDYTSSSLGGLYENYVPGTLSVDESWLFDTSRQSGDYTVVEADAGYYIFLYEGTGDIYLNYLVDTALRAEDYNAWYTANTTNYAATMDSTGMFFLDK